MLVCVAGAQVSEAVSVLCIEATLLQAIRLNNSSVGMIQKVGHREAPKQGNTGGHQIWAGDAFFFSRPNLHVITIVNVITRNYT